MFFNKKAIGGDVGKDYSLFIDRGHHQLGNEVHSHDPEDAKGRVQFIFQCKLLDSDDSRDPSHSFTLN